MPFFRALSGPASQELLEGRLVGRMLLHRLAAGATGVNQAI